jgi:hypothetical protein
MKFMLQNDSKKKGLILRIILFAAIVSLICLFLYSEKHATTNLLEKIQKISNENIVKIEIAVGDTDYDNLPKFELNKDDIKVLKNYLRHVDDTLVGGHNLTNYDCYLTFCLESGIKQTYTGGIYTQYDWNKNALYLSSKVGKSGWGIDTKVRVPGLGKWLKEKYPNTKK